MNKSKYSDIFQGDPRLFLTANGATLKFIGGQPILDRGLENMVLISLFTRRGWWGNTVFDDPQVHIGSDFEAAFEQPITLQALNDIRDAAEKALVNPIFGRVTVDVRNPAGQIIYVTIRIEPPGQDIQTLVVERNADNWIAQATDPAGRRER